MSSYQVDRARWATLSIFDQMGNIYSEVGRSMNAQKMGNVQQREQATTRALELFDATIEVLTNKHSPKVKEVLLAKEQFIEAIQGDTMTEAEKASLDQYFYHFALVARAGR